MSSARSQSDKSDKSPPSGMCDSIIMLIEKCNIDETELIQEVVQKKVYELKGSEPTLEERLTALVSDCTDDTSLLSVLKMVQSRVNDIQGTKESQGDQVSRKVSIGIFKEYMPKIELKIQTMVEQHLTKSTINIQATANIRKAITEYYHKRGFGCLSYTNGDVELHVKIKSEIANDALQQYVSSQQSQQSQQSQ